MLVTSGVVHESDPSPSQKQDVIANVHNHVAGHGGVNKTLLKLHSEGIAWPHMRQDVSNFVKNCLICQKVKQQKQIPYDSPYKLQNITAPMDSIATDTIGPLPTDSMGFTYIIVIIDEFSRYTELYPSVSTTAEAYVTALIQWISRFGVPKKIRSDGGSQFTAHLVQDVYKVLKIEHNQILPYHPAANGMVERCNAEVMKHLRAITLTLFKHEEWSKFLPVVANIINHTPNTATKVSPSRIIFGDALQNETFVTINMPTMDLSDANYLDEYVKNLSIALKQIKDDARSALLNTKPPTASKGLVISVGDYILITWPTFPRDKLAPRQLGPYRVTKIIRNDIFEIADDITNSPKKIHRSRITRVIPAAQMAQYPEQFILQLQASDRQEFFVEKILAHRTTNPKKKKNYEFLIKWLDYDDSYNSFEPYLAIRDTIAFDEYIRDKPILKKLFN